MPVKIKSICVYAIPLPYKTLGHGRVSTPEITLHDTVVCIESDDGLVGYGESCPLNPTYLDATTGGLRAALEFLCPPLIGYNPHETGVINTLMDRTVRGHEAAKSAIDLACWDLLGKFTGLPVKTLLGGAEVDGARLYDSIPMDTPQAMINTIEEKRKQGISVFQVKLGQGAEPDIERMRAIAEVLKPGERMICDANRGWTLEDARRVVAAAAQLPTELGLLIEQPCATYEECVSIRKVCDRPFVLDEVIDDTRDLVRASADDALDAVVIKLSHVGGLTKAHEMARLAMRLGLRMRIEDTVGAEIVRAAVAHLAVTVPERSLLAAYPHPAAVSLGKSGVVASNGILTCSVEPGLSFEPDMKILGEPIQRYS
ncbi:MAG: mandelate racemase/muconate lactonizing enzyme family protein [Granulosicoccus sp.]|nr:mandelate racemase/muconate lactonizing enzyme family protein [Granulosicoccus sp.]